MQKIVQLSKLGHSYIIKYDTGQEGTALAYLIEMVKNLGLSFDWYDAALMSHEIGRCLAKDIKDLAKDLPTGEQP